MGDLLGEELREAEGEVKNVRPPEERGWLYELLSLSESRRCSSIDFVLGTEERVFVARLGWGVCSSAGQGGRLAVRSSVSQGRGSLLSSSLLVVSSEWGE